MGKKKNITKNKVFAFHYTIIVYSFSRFGMVEDQKGALRLYTVQIPHKREKKPPPCYLTKWDGKSFLPMLTASCGTEVISSLAIR